MLIQTAATVNAIFDRIQKEFFYKEVLQKFFPDKNKRTEFESEIWLYLCEHSLKTLDVYNKGYFKYYFIRVVKNEVLSSSSNYHNNYRKTRFELTDQPPEEAEPQQYDFIEEEEKRINERIKKEKLELINEALNYILSQDPYQLTHIEMFKMYFFQQMTYRQISDKLNGIPTTTIWDNVQQITNKVKQYTNKPLL